MIRYYGLYANAHRGKKKKVGVDPSCPPIIEDEASFIPSCGWADMIRKVYEIRPSNLSKMRRDNACLCVTARRQAYYLIYRRL